MKCPYPLALLNSHVIKSFLFFLIQEILPSEYDYHLCKFSQENDNFHAILRVAITTKEDLLLWKRRLEETTKVTFRVSRTCHSKGVRTIFRKKYHCQHSGHRNNQKGKKNTGCKATLNLTLKKISK